MIKITSNYICQFSIDAEAEEKAANNTDKNWQICLQICLQGSQWKEEKENKKEKKLKIKREKVDISFLLGIFEVKVVMAAGNSAM